MADSRGIITQAQLVAAANAIISAQNASISSLRRSLKINTKQSRELLKELETRNIVSEKGEDGGRQVLVPRKDRAAAVEKVQNQPLSGGSRSTSSEPTPPPQEPEVTPAEPLPPLPETVPEEPLPPVPEENIPEVPLPTPVEETTPEESPTETPAEGTPETPATPPEPTPQEKKPEDKPKKKPEGEEAGATSAAPPPRPDHLNKKPGKVNPMDAAKDKLKDAAKNKANQVTDNVSQKAVNAVDKTTNAYRKTIRVGKSALHNIGTFLRMLFNPYFWLVVAVVAVVSYGVVYAFSYTQVYGQADEANAKSTSGGSLDLSNAAAAAVSMSWPLGTDSSVFNVPVWNSCVGAKSKATQTYINAKEQQNAMKWTDTSDSGYADCGKFVATVVNLTLDPDYPVGGTTQQLTYFINNPDKWEEVFPETNDDFVPGDVAIINRGNGNGHTYMFVGEVTDPDGNVHKYVKAESSLCQYAPRLKDFDIKLLTEKYRWFRFIGEAQNSLEGAEVTP